MSNKYSDDQLFEAKKEALELIMNFDKLHDPKSQGPIGLWAMAEALGAYLVMTARKQEEGMALAQVIEHVTDGAQISMVAKREAESSKAA